MRERSIPCPLYLAEYNFLRVPFSVVLIFCFVSMIFHVCRHDQSARTLAKQLRFNHQVTFKIHQDRSAVIMMGLVIGVFLVCFGMHLRCSFLTLSSSRCNDENYKIPVLVLNSAINPLAYAFFKRDIKKEFRRLIGQVVFKKSNQVEPSTHC